MADGGAVELSIGVLCIQGAFIEHVRALERVREIKTEVIRLNIVDVRKPAQLSGLDGLIIPGGESTTLSVFLNQDGFEEALRQWMRGGASPGVLWGTCAGLILIANALTEQKMGGQVTVRGWGKGLSWGRGGVHISCPDAFIGHTLKHYLCAVPSQQ